MLERLREHEGADQLALFGARQPSLLEWIILSLRRLSLRR